MTMSITVGIRVDQATQKGSAYDVIKVVTKATSAYAVRRFAGLTMKFRHSGSAWIQTKDCLVNGQAL